MFNFAAVNIDARICEAFLFGTIPEISFFAVTFAGVFIHYVTAAVEIFNRFIDIQARTWQAVLFVIIPEIL